MIGGLVTMRSFTGGTDFYSQQIVWILLSLLIFFVAAISSYRFLRRRAIVVTIFALIILSLVLVVLTGVVAGGAERWFDIGLFRVQPSEPAKLAVIIVLAKYFDRRHVFIHNFRHIIVSGMYTILIAGLVFIQPDFGSAVIIATIWFGVVLVAGISVRHIAVILSVAALAFLLIWTVGLNDFQKQRVTTFINPVADLQGAG